MLPRGVLCLGLGAGLIFPADSYSNSLARSTVHWLDDDPVEIYYGEFLLAQWVLASAPWNAYHSGIAFKNLRNGEKALWEYTPANTSSVMDMIIPKVSYDNLGSALLGGVDFGWRDEAYTQFADHWPENYETFVFIGKTTGRVFNMYASWAYNVYAAKFNAFVPVEVAILPGEDAPTDRPVGVIRSRMCHDFVTDSLWTLYEGGVRFTPNETDGDIFRDHIFLYATKVNPIQPLSAAKRRRWLRYLRALSVFVEDIRTEFTYARAALVTIWKLGLPLVMHSDHIEHTIHLAPPFINYCYLKLAYPPERHNALGHYKLCALGMQANLTNASIAWPWGPLIAVEDQVDRLPSLASMLLVILVALCAAPARGAVAEGKSAAAPKKRRAEGKKRR